MRTLSSARCFLLAAVLLSAFPTSLNAQSSQGGLRGVVKDQQGVIPGVTVTMINDANGVSRDTVTNGVGEYSFPAIEPGTYTVKATVQGYKTFERKAVPVSVQQFVGLDITLEIGALEETITVTGESPLIETTNASTGDVLDTRALESIPSAGRSVFLMANLTPTVQTSGNAHWNRMQDQVGNSAMSMGGGAVRANNYLVDGFPVTDLQNRASTNPTIEAVQDVKVQVHTYDAEMGRTGGGVMNMAAKSGANDFHGSGYTVFRPESLVCPTADPEAARPGERARVLAQRRRRNRRTDREEQDLLLVRGRKVRRQSAAADDRAGADRGGADRQFPGRHAQRRTGGHQGSAHRRAVSQQPDPREPAEFRRPQTGQLSAAGRYAGGQRQHELRHDRSAAEQGEPVHDEGRPSFQQRGGVERLLPAPGDARSEHEFQPGERLRRRQLSTRSRDQDVRGQQHVHPELVDGAHAARRVQQVRRQLQPERPQRQSSELQRLDAGLAVLAHQPDVRHPALPDDGHHRLQGIGMDQPAGERLLPVRRQWHA